MMKRYRWLGVFTAGLVLAAWGIAVNAQQPASTNVREVSATLEEPDPAATGSQVVAPLDTATFYAIADAYVYSATPTQTHGSATTLYVGSQTTSDAGRALFRFNLSSLPTTAIVDSANFQAYMSSASSTPPVLNAGVNRINAEWAEYAVNWANQPPAVSIGKVTGVSRTQQYYAWEVTGLAQAWVANPASNFGLELRSETEGTVGWRGFASRETVPATRPQLVIEYHLPACTDLQEPNDTFAQAFPITPAVEYLGCIPTPSDLDYFRFDVAPNTTISVELYSLPANYDLYLYAPDQTLLDSSANAGTTSEIVEYTNETTSGPFYAKVQSGGEWDLSNAYALKLTLTPVTVWPDLVINDVWHEGSQVCYEIENIGQATALQGHQTSLTVDGAVGPMDIVTIDLAPGAKTQGCFASSYQCTAPQDTLIVCADHGDDIAESDETNNCTEEIWTCDTTPPIITSGPTVSDITAASVTISWITDEASDSTVWYGRKAKLFEGEAEDASLTVAHAVALSGLQPSTTYRYVVGSADGAGNAVTSGERFFTTAPVPDSSPPGVSEVTLTRMSGKAIFYTIGATVPVDLDVERVEFTMDGGLLGKVYTAKPGGIPGLYEFPLVPAALGISREAFFAEHEIEAVAVDYGGLAGRLGLSFDPPYECADIFIEMDTPVPGTTLYFERDELPLGTTVPIVVSAYDQYEEECNHEYGADRIACQWEAHSIERIDFAVAGEPICSFPGNVNPYDAYTCDWNASGYGAGVYTIRVDVIADESCAQTFFRDVTVEQGEAEVDVTRQVTRDGNTFEVALTIVNHGHADFALRRVEDHIAGFQPIDASVELPGWRYLQVTSDCATTGESCDVTLNVSSDADPAFIRLEPGDSVTLSYEVVPVLLPDPEAGDQAIGDEPVRVLEIHRADGPTFDRPCGRVIDGALLANAVTSAMVESDYLIVTRPERLFNLYDPAGANALLVDMAELAQRKNGILGYLVGLFFRFSFIADDTIWEWGAGMRGGDGEPENWLNSGYLLLVGEADVVPSFSVLDADIWAATSHWGGVFPVRLVDNSYADTDGDLSPELIVGRIIGNDIASMRLPLEMARLDAFDCSRALTVSGLDTDTVNLDSFMTNANEIAGAFTERFTEVDVEHWSEYDTVTDALDSFVTAVQAQDVIVYSDHGGRKSWSSVLRTRNFPLDFLGSHPIVAAFACSTGYYDGINSIADKFLDRQAGGYIGSTELSGIGTNCEAGLMFANRWPAEGVSAGMALRDTKRDLLRGDESEIQRLWVMEYNLYGDPKYGVWPIPEMAVAESDAPSAILSPTSLEVIVPDYQVTSSASGDLDTARIPGGLMLLEPGLPMVPIYVVTQPYPKGYRVQDVVLVTRSGLVTTTGLNLPLVSDDPASTVVSGSSESAESSTGWYPEKDFAWKVEEEIDGTTTLIIRMYPFYYDMATTDVQFYKNYSFDIDVITSTVEIAAVTTDKQMYPQGERVSIGMVISGTNSTEDLIVEAGIRHYSSHVLVDGLPLRSLTGVQGLAIFSTQWDSAEPGLYYAEVTLRNAAGDILDRKTAQFTVGIAAGEITTFTVTPSLFDIGTQIAVSFTFVNTGTVPLTGTAVVQIQTDAGAVVQELSHDYGDLAPGNHIGFADVWDTTGITHGSYRVISHVLYESTATEPRAVIVRTRRSLYLPLILKGAA